MGSITFSMIIGFDAFVDAFSIVAIPCLGLTENEASWFASVECFCVCFFAPIGGKIAERKIRTSFFQMTKFI